MSLPRWSTAAHVAGVDEAGRGPLAGPVVAAAVILPPDYVQPRINDSKKLSPAERDTLYEEIIQVATAWSAVAVGPRRIDAINILQATKCAMRHAAFKTAAQHYLIDGNQSVAGIPSQETIVGGDRRCLEIAAASILAKVTRDRLMERLANRYPGYGFEIHKGYGTASHRAAIKALGPCPAHRFTFRGVREYLHQLPGSSIESCLSIYSKEDRPLLPR